MDLGLFDLMFWYQKNFVSYFSCTVMPVIA